MEVKQVILFFAVSAFLAASDGRPHFSPSPFYPTFFDSIMLDPGLDMFHHMEWPAPDFAAEIRRHQQFHMMLHQQLLNQQRQWWLQITAEQKLQVRTYVLAEVFRQYYNNMISQYNQATEHRQQKDHVGRVENRLTTVNAPIYRLNKGVTWRKFLGSLQPQVSKQAEEFTRQVLSDLQAGNLTQQIVSSPDFFLNHAHAIVCNTTVPDNSVTPAPTTERPEPTTPVPEVYSPTSEAPKPVSTSIQPVTEPDSAVLSSMNLAYNPNTGKYEYSQDDQHSIQNVPIV